MWPTDFRRFDELLGFPVDTPLELPGEKPKIHNYIKTYFIYSIKKTKRAHSLTTYRVIYVLGHVELRAVMDDGGDDDGIYAMKHPKSLKFQHKQRSFGDDKTK